MVKRWRLGSGVRRPGSGVDGLCLRWRERDPVQVKHYPLHSNSFRSRA